MIQYSQLMSVNLDMHSGSHDLWYESESERLFLHPGCDEKDCVEKRWREKLSSQSERGVF